MSVIWLVVWTIYIVYSYSFCIWTVLSKPRFLQICYEMRPIALPANVLEMFHTLFIWDGPWWARFILGLINLFYVIAAYVLKDPEDRWKKRRRKAAARIKEIAGKLVVVPEPGVSGA